MTEANNLTELVWYVATFFGSGMLVVIWWVLRTGFNRMIKKFDDLSETVRQNELNTAKIEQRLEDHIKNDAIHRG